MKERTHPDANDPRQVCMSREEEKAVIRRAQRGHADAFRELVEAYKDRLYAFIWRMVRNHHEAEDLCQTAFVRAYESLASYNDNYAFSTWLFTIGYRLCLNALRKRRALTGAADLSLVGAVSPDSTADEVAGTDEARRLRSAIWCAVDQLSPPQRSAVMLFYREEMSCQEIGVVLGIPAVTVKSHLHRARAKLKGLLAGETEADWTALRLTKRA